MIQSIILIAIACLTSGILYGCALLTKNNPELISGFKWGNTPEEIEEDKQWLKMQDKYMRLSAAVTLAGGIVTALLDSVALYIFFLCAPMLVCISYCHSKKPRRSLCDKLATNIAIGIAAVVLLCTVISLVYVCSTDLDATVSKDKIEFNGLYGVTLECNDVTSVEMTDQLPDLSLRKNGFSWENTKLGYFNTTEGENVLLFVHGNPPLIRLTDKKNGTIYINTKNENATIDLYKEIKRNAKRTQPGQ